MNQFTLTDAKVKENAVTADSLPQLRHTNRHKIIIQALVQFLDFVLSPEILVMVLAAVDDP